MNAIKTVNIKITETVKVKKCVQEAQKTELIYCPVAFFLVPAPQSQSMVGE